MKKTYRYQTSDSKIIGLACAGIIAFAIAWIFIVPALAMVAWNHAVVPAFGGPEVSYWQAFGIVFLFSLISSLLRRHD